MNKVITTIIFIFTLAIVFPVKSYSKSEISLNASDNNIQKDEEITLTANITNTDIAAYTLWIYYDKDKVECITNEDNINSLDGKIIYTWFSNTGKNKNIEELINLKFKTKQDGIASFNIIAELYDENGKEIDVNYKQTEVKIGEETEEKIEDLEVITDDNVEEDNAFLKIMRVNKEGINPDFDKNIKEYYLIVNEDVKDLDITAVAENKDAQVNITGNKNLKIGLNKIKIKVTSKDKSKTNEYTINVTKTENEKSANADLETLAVEYFELIPEFDKTITNYSSEVSNEVNKLNILAISSDESAKVQITGNENLKVGDNQITISVTARNGITNKKYYINVHKRSEEEEIQEKEEQQNIIKEANVVLEQMNNENNKIENSEAVTESNDINIVDRIIAIIGSLATIIMLGVVIIQIKKK